MVQQDAQSSKAGDIGWLTMDNTDAHGLGDAFDAAFSTSGDDQPS